MVFLLSFLFIIHIIISAFLQASDNPLKNKVSPGLTTFFGLLVSYGGIASNVPLTQSIILCTALLLLTASNFVVQDVHEQARIDVSLPSMAG